jgi:Insertion element 4 transposase N-terminal/Transposase DDE domain
MPRYGWVKPVSDRRLSDLVAVRVLTRVFPPHLVDEVIAATGRTEQRNRSLPARLTAYFVMGMALYSEGSYADVLGLLTDGLSWASGWQESYPSPSKSAIFQARVRLGAEPLEALFTRVARPLGTPGTPGVWLSGRRLVAIDGACLDVADTPANEEFFGRPNVAKGEKSAFPQARIVAVAECGTHAILDAVVGTCATSEAALADKLIGRLQPGSLLLAEGGFSSYALWNKAIGTGADLLWRARTDLLLEHRRTLEDASWLGLLRPGGEKNAEPIIVRVIDHTVEDARETPEPYRLFTTILDPQKASATDLAAAYIGRWEIERALDELKTQQRGPRTVLRSKSPELVLQEIWGSLCCHYAIRALMAEVDA